MRSTSKEKLGLDDRGFGVANRLRPTAEDLRVVEVPAAGRVRLIRAFTADVDRRNCKVRSRRLGCTRRLIAGHGGP
jgi:hypothetical protein